MSTTSQETAATCEVVSASTDEQLRAIQSVTDAAETLTELSEELSLAVNQFKVQYLKHCLAHRFHIDNW